MGSILRECKWILTSKVKSLWINLSDKCINVNGIFIRRKEHKKTYDSNYLSTARPKPNYVIINHTNCDYNRCWVTSFLWEIAEVGHDHGKRANLALRPGCRTCCAEVMMVLWTPKTAEVLHWSERLSLLNERKRKQDINRKPWDWALWTTSVISESAGL